MKARLIIIVLFSILGLNGVNAKEAYAVLIPEKEEIGHDYGGYYYATFYRMKFYYDDERTIHENEWYEDPQYYGNFPMEGESLPSVHPEVYLINEEMEFPEWYNKLTFYYGWENTNRSGIVIDFDKSFADYCPNSTKHWFDGVNIVEINGINNLNTSMVTDMSYMFAGCKENVLSLGYNKWFTDFKHIFSQLDFSSVKNMSHMVDGLEEIVIGDIAIPSGVNTDGCFSSLKYVELTSKDIVLPEDFFISTNTECSIVFPDDFFFGTDTSTGHFTWKGGFFYGGILEPYAIFRSTSRDYYGVEDRELRHGYYLFLFYDKKKEKRIRDFQNEDSKDIYEYYYDHSDWLNKSSQICDWGKWDKEVRFNFLSSEVPHSSMGYYCSDIDYGWGSLYYPYVHITIDPSCADYYPIVSTEDWFDFYLYDLKKYYGEIDDQNDYAIYSLPEECKLFTGLEYLNEPSLNIYALLSKDKSTLSFYNDYKQHARINEGIIYTLNNNATSPDWLSENETITKVVFDPSFADARPVTTRYWFNNMANLETIEGLQYLNTSEVTSMYSMFGGCTSLTSLDLSTFDTSKTTSMTALFNGCTSLKEIDLSSFNTTSVSSIRLMFQNCTSLETVDLSSFDTSGVTDLRNLFYGCTSLTGLDLSTMEIADGAQTGNMFYGCKTLKSLKISSTFGKINSNACIGVGTTSTPCRVYAPEGFSFGTDTSGESFKWKGGYFKLGIDPTISVGDLTAYTGVNAEASLSLTIGHDDYTGYQFDIVLPQGMSLVKTQSGFKYKLSSRFNGDGVSCAINQQGDGSYRAICYSTNHKTISGTEGVLITFPIVANETVAAGTYTGQIRNFTLNDIGNNSIHVPNVEFSLTVLDAATGDVNHDGCVDISDVLLTVDYILGKNPANYIRSDGDINHDGEINISDVLSIVDIILGQNSYNAPANARTSTLDDLTLLRKDNTYTLCLNNHEPYAGFQMLLTLPEGSTLRNASLVTDRSDGHRLTVRDHGDGTYTLIAYASDGRQLRDNGTPLLRLTVNGTQGNDDVQVKNILFSTLQRETVLLQDVNGIVTGIMDIATDNNDTAPTYNTQGQRVSPNYRGLVISGGQKRIRK